MSGKVEEDNSIARLCFMINSTPIVVSFWHLRNVLSTALLFPAALPTHSEQIGIINRNILKAWKLK